MTYGRIIVARSFSKPIKTDPPHYEANFGLKATDFYEGREKRKKSEQNKDEENAKNEETGK